MRGAYISGISPPWLKTSDPLPVWTPWEETTWDSRLLMGGFQTPAPHVLNSARNFIDPALNRAPWEGSSAPDPESDGLEGEGGPWQGLTVAEVKQEPVFAQVKQEPGSVARARPKLEPRQARARPKLEPSGVARARPKLEPSGVARVRPKLEPGQVRVRPNLEPGQVRVRPKLEPGQVRVKGGSRAQPAPPSLRPLNPEVESFRPATVTRRNYAAWDSLRSLGLVDQGEDGWGARALVLHAPRNHTNQELLNVTEGDFLHVFSDAGGLHRLRVLYTGRHRYYAPGTKVSTLVVGVDDREWEALLLDQTR